MSARTAWTYNGNFLCLLVGEIVLHIMWEVCSDIFPQWITEVYKTSLKSYTLFLFVLLITIGTQKAHQYKNYVVRQDLRHRTHVETK